MIPEQDLREWDKLHHHVINEYFVWPLQLSLQTDQFLIFILSIWFRWVGKYISVDCHLTLPVPCIATLSFLDRN